jgi:hypothetical protein
MVLLLYYIINYNISLIQYIIPLKKYIYSYTVYNKKNWKLIYIIKMQITCLKVIKFILCKLHNKLMTKSRL